MRQKQAKKTPPLPPYRFYVKLVTSFIIPACFIIFGTLISVSLSTWFEERPINWFPSLAFAGIIHLSCVGLNTLLGETIVEDIVKSVVWCIIGGLGMPVLWLIGTTAYNQWWAGTTSIILCEISVLSSAVLAICSNQTVRWLWKS